MGKDYVREAYSPPFEGGVDATSRKCREATFDGADRVVAFDQMFQKRVLKHSILSDHPVCAI